MNHGFPRNKNAEVVKLRIKEVAMSRFELSPSQVEFHMRELTEYEQRIHDFMNENARGHGQAILAAKNPAEFEDAVQRMIERYEDWATD
jgi:2-phosphoglycerate kinase